MNQAEHARLTGLRRQHADRMQAAADVGRTRDAQHHARQLLSIDEKLNTAQPPGQWTWPQD